MMTDYDVPYECACCGKKTTNYLCGLCTTSHKGMAELTALRAEMERKEREWGYICLGWNEEIDKLQARLSLAEAVVEAARKWSVTMNYSIGEKNAANNILYALRAYDAGKEGTENNGSTLVVEKQ